MKNLKVVIIGAGMGGLTCAIALRQAGYEVEIYEKVSKIRPAGAAISLWSNGVKVLNSLGLSQEIASIGGQMERTAYYSHTGEKLTDFSLQPLIDRVGQKPYPVARTDLQEMLLNTLGQITFNSMLNVSRSSKTRIVLQPFLKMDAKLLEMY